MGQKTNHAIISSKNCVVAVLDFLGYENLVEKKKANEIREILNKLIAQKDGSIDVNEEIKETFQRIHIQVISDTLIFVFEIVPPISDKIKELDVFLQLISILYLRLTIETGFFLQGGVVYGDYYQEELNKPSNQFIFSKALVEAHKLSKKALGPIVLVSEDFYQMVKNNISALRCGILQNRYKEYYLDAYGFWKGSVWVHKKEIEEIRKLFNSQVQENINNSKVLVKYVEFIRYHNWTLSQMNNQKIFEEIKDFFLEIPGRSLANEKF